MHFVHWTDEVTLSESHGFILELVQCIADGLPRTGVLDTVLGWVESCNYTALAAYELVYEDVDLSTASAVRQILAFFQKRLDLPIGVDRKQVASDKFYASETLCRETNQIIRMVDRGDLSFPRGVEQVIFTARRKIASILGDLPSLEALKPRFGPGATTQVRKILATPRQKLGMTKACSTEMAPFAQIALEALGGWCEPILGEAATTTVEIHPGRVSFVPKNAKTDRVVAVEPMLNTMFQLAYGDYIADRLKRRGVDISDQTRNQRLAKIGSQTGALATLDLSSASDTIARELVYLLLPLDWAHRLSSFRTVEMTLGLKQIKLEKFSSMGNGFTFPLETLIFHALSLAVCECECVDDSMVSTYGDDIIVPSSVVERLKRVLHVLGFQVNDQKSFHTGPFRESCGADYFLGFDIRPFYVRGPISCRVLFSMYNSFLAKGMERAARLVHEAIPEHIRIYGPAGYGDGHLHTPGACYRKQSHLDRGWGGYVFDTYSLGKRTLRGERPGDRYLPQYSVYAQPPGCASLPEGRKSNLYRLRAYARNFRERGSALSGGPLGPISTVVPGFKGYRRISIYTLDNE